MRFKVLLPVLLCVPALLPLLGLPRFSPVRDVLDYFFVLPATIAASPLYLIFPDVPDPVLATPFWSLVGFALGVAADRRPRREGKRFLFTVFGVGFVSLALTILVSS